VGEKINKASGSGNGGFDAFNDAMKKILNTDDVQFPELTDFEIRIPKGGSTNALTECFITWNDGTPGRSKPAAFMRIRYLQASTR
jgi:D-citramalate synthase